MSGSTVQWQKLSEEGGPDPITMKGTNAGLFPRGVGHQRQQVGDLGCGILGFRPAWLQRFATPNTFFGMVCACIMVEVAAHTGYVGGVLSTIEKNFQLSSSQVAFITVVNHIGAFTAVVTSYIGNKINRPRVIALGVEIIGIGQFICALPHFLTYSYTTNPSSSTNNSSTILCESTLSGGDLNSTDCDLQARGSILSHAWLLILGELITGIGSGPVIPLLITYIDDCVGKVKVSVYVGILFACAATGPVFGYLLSALTLSYHVDFDRSHSMSNHITIKPTDSRWVGAWWLGFLILGPLMMLMAPFLCLFPREMASQQIKDACENPNCVTDTRTSTYLRMYEAVIGYLSALKRIFTNLPFLCMTFSTTALVIAGLGQFYFGAKYLETQFDLTTWTASLILAGMCLPGTLVGILLGGFLVKRWDLTTTPHKCALMSGIMGIVSCLLIPLLFFLGCTNSHFAGLTTSYPSLVTHSDSPLSIDVRRPRLGHQYFSLTDECNSRCDCSQRGFRPVCGGSGITFASPCFAGCDSAINETVFNNCSCIPMYYGNDDNPSFGSTTLGQCLEMCATVIPYAFIYAVAGFCMALSQNPNYMVTLRSVESRDRAIGLGMNAVVMRGLGNLLGPMYFGVAIDTACILHHTNECGKEGACLVYDIRKYRFIFVGMIFVFVVVHTCFVGVAYRSLKSGQAKLQRQHVHLEERLSDLSRTSTSSQQQESNAEDINRCSPVM